MDVISSSRVTCFDLKMSTIGNDWVRNIRTILDSYNYPCRFTEVVNKRFNKKTNQDDEYKGIVLTSVNSIQLGKLYDIWYPEGVKIIPKYFTVTPTILLHFFIGDGYITKTKLQNGKLKIIAIKLCTDCFTLEDISYVAGLIHSALHVNTLLEKK